MPWALTGAAVSGHRAGRFAAEDIKNRGEAIVEEDQVAGLKEAALAPLKNNDGIDPEHILLGMHEALIPYDVTIISRGDRMQKAIERIEKIRDTELPWIGANDPHGLTLANEVRNMVLVAEMYLRSRLIREESRDSCLREDYPMTDTEKWLKRSLVKHEGGNMKVWMEDLPEENYTVKPKREKFLHPVFEAAKKEGIPWG
jgi:succinate dehydrogenase/fumarate reductase flavoprotein subunit